MNKKIVICLCLIGLCLPVGMGAAEYSLVVESGHGFSYSGDYSGEVTTGYRIFTIGPFNEPFSVNLAPLTNDVELASGQAGRHCWWHIDQFYAWNVDGEFIYQPEITVVVDKPDTPVWAIESWAVMYADDFNCGADPRGIVRIDPAEIITDSGTRFTTYLKVDTGSADLASINVIIQYDPAVLSVDTTPGNNGVTALAPGIMVVNAETPGTLNIALFSSTGIGSGSGIVIGSIHWLAENPGTTDLALTIDTLLDMTYSTIGAPPQAISGRVTVTGAEGTPGDVNGDGVVNIVDALMIAQHVVGLNPPNFNIKLANLNSDGMLNIVDALICAQYYVGVVSSIPVE